MLAVLVGNRVFLIDQPIVASVCNSPNSSIRIIDDSVTSDVRSVEVVADQQFKLFIKTISNYVSLKLSESTACQKDSGEGSRINLTFVRLPLVTSGENPLKSPPVLETSVSDIICNLDSPWAKIIIHRSNPTIMNAVFVWNERQFLLDQVILSGEDSPFIEPLMPLPNSSFEQYAQYYANTEILHREGELQGSISQKIPSDVLWLFRNSWQSTRGSFSNIARSGMKKTLEHGADEYTNLTKSLIDQCFTSSETKLKYTNILDLKTIFTLDQYEIQKLN